ncbi:MAG: hypothetical protein EXR67_03770 [Dehalococcoidia bacterium]|nr:hypothetical protein [Dehalococcoidia bacterium]
MEAFVIGLLLVVVCLGVVSWPFFRKRSVPSAEAESFDKAVGIQIAASQELKALEAERAVGEMTEAEFFTRRNQLRLAAAHALRDQDLLRPQAQRTPDIESEVLAARRGRQARQPKCPVCSNALLDGTVECPRCGTLFSKNGHVVDSPNR